MKKAHAKVPGPRDVPQCFKYSMSKTTDSFRMNSILCLSYYAVNETAECIGPYSCNSLMLSHDGFPLKII